MQINPFSITMSIVLFTVISTVCGLFLTRTKGKHLWLVAFLLVLCILRMVLPIEFNGAINVNVWEIYPDLFALMEKPIYRGISVGDSLLILWLTVSMILTTLEIYRLTKQSRLVAFVRFNDVPLRLEAIGRRAADGVGCTAYVNVQISHDYPTPIMTGFRRPVILLPTDIADLDDRQIEYILRHEISHYIKGDLWYILGIRLLVCLLWWNPVVYLLHRSVIQLLELRSDQLACQTLSMEEKINYSAVILKQLRSALGKEKRLILTSFIGVSEKRYLKHRIKLLTSPPHKKASPWMTGVIVAVCMLFFVGSYTFIVQPAALPDDPNDTDFVFPTPENAYLVPISDDQYEIWIEGTYYATITSESAKMPPFDQFPIYKKEDVPQ